MRAVGGVFLTVSSVCFAQDLKLKQLWWCWMVENLKVPNISLNMVFNSNWNALEQFVIKDYEKQYKD